VTLRIIEAPSPNRGPRRGGLRPELVVIHHTAMASAEAALDRLRDPEAAVSAHWLIAEDGRIWRLVAEEERAWHAGAGRWQGHDDVNSRSIGIELANPGPLAGLPPFPARQMAALERLLTAILDRWSIPPAGVVAHSDTAPARKADPGPKFDWAALARAGLAIWPEAAGEGAPDPARFAAAAAAIGYDAHGDADAEAILRAFRLRFAPGVTGPLTGRDVALAEAAARLCAARRAA
jgi:N-acetylmuramoyl-L-alanine amidase